MALENAPILAVTGFGTIALGLIVVVWGYVQAKTKKFNSHRNLMLTAAVVNALFLVQYIIRFTTTGETPFPGPDNIRLYVYYPILIVHITGAIITIGLVLRHLILSLRYEQRTEQGAVLFDKDYRPRHRKFGRITFLFWITSYIGGIVIFLMLYILF